MFVNDINMQAFAYLLFMPLILKSESEHVLALHRIHEGLCRRSVLKVVMTPCVCVRLLCGTFSFLQIVDC